jgi:hypothetical protein
VSDNFPPIPSRRHTEPVGPPEQGLLPCDLCRAANLPNSYYCCRCGEPLAGGPLKGHAGQVGAIYCTHFSPFERQHFGEDDRGLRGWVLKRRGG